MRVILTYMLDADDFHDAENKVRESLGGNKDYNITADACGLDNPTPQSLKIAGETMGLMLSRHELNGGEK